MTDAGDLIIDGGNTDFRDTVKSARLLEQKGLRFMDIGVSGGVEGAKYCEGHGAGHYAKTIHNGVEYAIMQAYAEGYDMQEALYHSDHSEFRRRYGGSYFSGKLLRSSGGFSKEQHHCKCDLLFAGMITSCLAAGFFQKMDKSEESAEAGTALGNMLADMGHLPMHLPAERNMQSAGPCLCATQVWVPALWGNPL